MSGTAARPSTAVREAHAQTQIGADFRVPICLPACCPPIRILDGAAPADVPVEIQESLELTINPEAAERMGFTLPESVVEKAARTV